MIDAHVRWQVRSAAGEDRRRAERGLELALTLIELRTTRGWEPQELATRMGVPLEEVDAVEEDGQYPAEEWIGKAMRAFGFTAWEFVERGSGVRLCLR